MTGIIDKVRGLIADLQSSDFQTFSYTTSAVFKIATPNATATSVLVNGADIGASNWSYDSSDQEVTITSSLVNGDAVEINFTYYSYSDTELQGYITGALVYFSVFSYTADEDYEVEDGVIYPIPSSKDEDIIALITSIIIKPNWSSYKTPTLEVRYPRTIDKDTKIEKLLQRAKWGLSEMGVIYFD